MTNEDVKKKRKTAKRSPGYPMLSLEESIQKAKILWDKDKNNPIPLGAAFEHLGYKTIGGYGGRVFSAMKQFGLIYQSKNDIILTSEAVDLALHEQQDNTYIKTIKILSLKPILYEKLFNEYNGQLPSDATLRIKLIKDYEFNPDKVGGFLSDFRKTIEFAKLQKPDTSAEEPPPLGDKTMQITNTAPTTTSTTTTAPPTTPSPFEGEREIATYTIGRGLKARIIISGEQPTTIKSIKKLIKFLQENEEDLPESIDDEKEDPTEQ